MQDGPIKLTRSVVRVLLAIVLCTAALAAAIAAAQGDLPDAARAGAQPPGHAHREAAGGGEGGHHRARHHVMVMATPGVAAVSSY